MKVFLSGATGFIGRALAKALAERGHEVTCGVRDPDERVGPDGCAALCRVDFRSDHDPGAWAMRLQRMDAVVNAAGLIAERDGASFDAVHTRAPTGLFNGALDAGVRRAVQVSALGADAGAQSAFHRSKKAADDALAAMPLDWVVVLPSLVYGPGGASARMFTTLAALPWIPVPGRGDYEVQPVHVDDVVAAIVALVESADVQRRRVPLVGPQALRFDDFLRALRLSLGLGPARFIHVPKWLASLGVALASFTGAGMLSRETLAMLYRGNVADPGSIRALLGRAPRAVSEFIPADEAPAQRASAQLRWLLPVLRVSIATVWIVTGVLSLGIFPVETSFSLLARAGVPAAHAPAALYGAAALDLLLGVLSLSAKRRPWIWLAQMALIAGYTVIITVKLPEFWLHPYGPVLKNIPLLAAIWVVYELERRPSNT